MVTPMQIILYAQKLDAVVILPKLRGALGEANLQEEVADWTLGCDSSVGGRIFLSHSMVRFVDHGQNPLGDADLRPWIDVKSLDYNRQYRGFGSVYGYKFSLDDAEGVVLELVKDLSEFCNIDG